jgi:CMP-N-acetylneuraminic acid synthetase
MKIVALVPMRHHSERVPGKNYRPCGGAPLYQHILRTLDKCPTIDRIVVDTDSPIIMDGIREKFPRVKILERPEHLRSGEVPMNEVLIHDALHVQADLYIQTHSTNPLLRPDTIERALKSFLESYPSCDSLFSVTRLQTRLWDREGKPVNHDPEELLRTQDLPPIFEENSCIYIFGHDSLLQRRNRLGERPLMFEIDAREAWDIDEELDFEIAELMLRLRDVPNDPTG